MPPLRGSWGGGQVGVEVARQFAADRLAGLEDAAPVGRPKAELILADAVPVLPAWQSRGCSGCWPNRSSRGGMAMVTGATARGNYRI
jgi:hypothetical protein